MGMASFALHIACLNKHCEWNCLRICELSRWVTISRISGGLQCRRKPCFFYCLLYLAMLCLLNSRYKPPAAMSCLLGAYLNISLHVTVTVKSAVGPMSNKQISSLPRR